VTHGVADVKMVPAIKIKTAHGRCFINGCPENKVADHWSKSSQFSTML
jgi:hypothetical protein